MNTSPPLPLSEKGDGDTLWRFEAIEVGHRHGVVLPSVSRVVWIQPRDRRVQ
jgi:hypothetical protein